MQENMSILYIFSAFSAYNAIYDATLCAVCYVLLFNVSK